MFIRLLVAGICLLPVIALADDAPKPSGHAPIGVMGDHTHTPGSWMLSYKYETTHYSGMRDGHRDVDSASLISQYGESPTEMDMDMHMLEAMYGITADLTLMVMLHYMEMDMAHVAHNGHSHAMTLRGVGDTEVTGLYTLYQRGRHSLHVNAGFSLPTGNSDKKFADHHNNIYSLPYNMQFGSGTVDPIFGLTYTGREGDWSWGAQTINTMRIYDNHTNYRLGNEYSLTGWVARDVTEFASLSFRLDAQAWGNVKGRNPGLPLSVIAGADPKGQGGERIVASAGLNLLAPAGTLKGHRLGLEGGFPIYERFNGPQPKMAYYISLGWQYGF